MHSRLGIVGGGQLGKMLSVAAANMGIQTCFIDPSDSAVAASVSQQIKAAFDDSKAVQKLFNETTAVTFEFENVSVQAIKEVSDLSKLSPSLDALYVANDRIREKEFFKSCGLKVADYEAIIDCAQLQDSDFVAKVLEATKSLVAPVIVKTCSLGYDGKGQVCINSLDLDAETKAELIQLKKSDRVVIEKKINFSREVSVVAVRSKDGEIKVYPVPTNVHRQGILFSSIVLENKVNPNLSKILEIILNKLQYVGILALELFEVEGNYLANEMAPRVHNTGHWTIEGAVTSQFENHVRAVMGLPLGATDLRFPTAMLNIIGTAPRAEEVLKIKGTHLHLYGKEPRAKRKIGHITIEAKTEQELLSRVEQVSALL